MKKLDQNKEGNINESQIRNCTYCRSNDDLPELGGQTSLETTIRSKDGWIYWS